MRYYGSVYRPPSEARSLIVQVTYGCSHNTCAFCSMYKEKRFSVRPLEEVLEDFRIARQVYHHVEKVFLADGDALVRKAPELYTILDAVRELFPAFIISIRSSVLRIRRLINAVLKTTVSTNPSLEPRSVLSLSGSSTPLAG